MRMQAIALTTAAAMMMTLIWVVSTHAVILLNEAGTDVVGVDIAGLSNNVTDLSAQRRGSR